MASGESSFAKPWRSNCPAPSPLSDPRWFFHPDGQFYAWYANLEASAVAWSDAGLAGLDTVDWDLDVWIHPDLSWEWKDEELFVARLAVPDAYWVDDEDRVRR